MAAFVTDVDGQGTRLGGEADDDANGQEVDTFEPGMIHNLPVGKDITVASPPQATDYPAFSASQLRAIAAGLGVTYEDLTGDYSQVNYSSARMARLAHERDVFDWQWNMLIPQFCAPAWKWMLQAIVLAGDDVEIEPADWTAPPLPMLDPDKEGAANTKMIRAGMKTHDEMVREQGYQPEQYWKAYAEGLKRLDKYGIVLDSDPRKTAGSGQAQASESDAASAQKPTTNGVSKPNGTKPASPSKADA
jgi:lambda family phage portal protein